MYFIGKQNNLKHNIIFGYIFGDKQYDNSYPVSVDETIYYLPNTLKTISLLSQNTIEANTFKNCKKLTNIKLSSTIKQIDVDAFIGCNSLVSIDIDNSNKIYASKEGVLYNKDFSKLLHCCKGYSKKVFNIINEVKIIKSKAFIGCINIEKICIPASITKIEKDSFSYCRSLKSIVIDYNFFNEKKVFFDFRSIYENNLKINDLNIEEDIINNCINLEVVEFNDIVLKVDNNNLYVVPKNPKLEITLPNQIISIMKCLVISNRNIDTIRVYGNVTTIEDNTFNNFDKIKYIILPNTINTIGISVFSNCKELKSIILPSELNVIPKNMFSNCISLETLRIPSKVNIIEAEAFSNCSSLVKVTLPSELKKISEFAFINCVSLKNINIPNKVTYIESNAFLNCVSLENITFLNNIKYIGKSAFVNCPKMKINNLSSNLIYDYNIFNDNEVIFNTNINIIKSLLNANFVYKSSNVFRLEFNDVKISINENVINIEYKIDIFITKQLTTLLKAITNDIMYTLKINGETSKICSNAFTYLNNVESIILTDNISIIENSAFNLCTGLKKIYLPKKLTIIESNLFHDCENLEDAIIPNSVKRINSSAFYNCRKLEFIKLPKSLEIIDKNAFYNCNSLKCLYLYNRLIDIKEQALFNCFSLKYIVILENEIDNKPFDEFSLYSIVIKKNIFNHLDNKFNYCEKGNIYCSFDRCNKKLCMFYDKLKLM